MAANISSSSYIFKPAQPTATVAESPDSESSSNSKRPRIDAIAISSLSAGSAEMDASADSLSRKCKWVMKIYTAGEKTLARIYLRTLSNLPQQLLNNALRLSSALSNFSSEERQQLFDIFQAGIEIRLKQLKDTREACFTPGSSMEDCLGEGLRYIAFGQFNPAILKPVYLPDCCFPFKTSGTTSILNIEGVLANIMEFIGDIQPLANVSKEWRHKVHILTSPFIPRIVDHIDGVKKLFEERFDADANFFLVDLIMRTVRTLTSQFTMSTKRILSRLENELYGMLSDKENFEKITDQPYLMKLVLRQKPHLLEFASDDIKSNIEFIKELVKINGVCIKHAAEPLRACHEIVLLAVEQNPVAYEYIDESERECEDIIKLAFPKRGELFCEAPIKVRESREYLKLALTLDGGFTAVKCSLMGDDIWFDNEIVDLALMNDREGEKPILNYRRLPRELKYGRDFNLKACMRNPKEFPYTRDEFRSDFDFCKQYFVTNPSSFVNLYYEEELYEVVPEEVVNTLWLDRDFSLALIMCNEFTDFSKPIIAEWLKYWHKDRELMIAASINLTKEHDVDGTDSEHTGEALRYAHESLLKDVSFIKQIVIKIGTALQWIPVDILLTYDVSVFELALNNNPEAVQWIPQSKLDDHPYLYDLALQGNTEVWLRPQHKSEEESLKLARIAIKRDYRVFKLFPPLFKAKAEFVEVAVKGCSSMILYASPDWRENYWCFRQVLHWNPIAFNYALPQFRSYHYFKISAIGQNCINGLNWSGTYPYSTRLKSYLEDLKNYRSSSSTTSRETSEKERKT